MSCRECCSQLCSLLQSCLLCLLASVLHAASRNFLKTRELPGPERSGTLGCTRRDSDDATHRPLVRRHYIDSSNLNLTLATHARYSSGPTKTRTIRNKPSTTTAAAAAQEPIFSDKAS